MRMIKVLYCLLFTQHLIAQINKAPAYPLITHDPYFSIWSFTDQLNASATKHWTGTDQSILGFIKVDGKDYRVLGGDVKNFESVLPAADEVNYTVSYTGAEPAAGWETVGFDDAKWKTGMAPFSE